MKARGLCNNHYQQWFQKVGPQGKYAAYSFKTNDPELLKAALAQKWKLRRDGCWQWHGATTQARENLAPYGRIVANGKPTKAHRLSWIVHRGTITSQQSVLHRCNNSLCVNPDHLYLGTHADNMRDMSVSGRSRTQKLSDEAVREIRARTIAGTIPEVAKHYGVSEATIKDIRYRNKRRHVQPA